MDVEPLPDVDPNVDPPVMAGEHSPEFAWLTFTSFADWFSKPGSPRLHAVLLMLLAAAGNRIKLSSRQGLSGPYGRARPVFKLLDDAFVRSEGIDPVTLPPEFRGPQVADWAKAHGFLELPMLLESSDQH